MEMYEFRRTYSDRWYRVFVEPKHYVEIHVMKGNELTGVRRFVTGDEAEYDSFNLSYTGKILSITAKSATFSTTPGSRRTRRIKWDEFATRNWDFDAERVKKENLERMLYL